MTSPGTALERGSRLTLLAALVAPLLALTAAIVLVPNMRFSVVAPRVRPVLEAVTLVAAAIIAGVSYLRYSMDRDRLWLFVSLAFLVISVHQVIFEVLLPPTALAWSDPMYPWLAARLEMGVLILMAVSTGRAPRHPEWSAARTYMIFGTLAFGALALTQEGILLATLRSGLPVPGAGATPVTLGTADVLLGSVGAAVFLAAAGGLLLSTDRRGSALVWLAAGLVMTAFSHLHYLLEPTLFTDRVSTGDLLRIAMAAVLVAAILADVRRSYAEERDRSRQLAGAFEEQRRRVQELEDLDRLRADLHRMVNHEIRHPVAAIRTLAMTLATKWDRLDEGQKRHAVQGLLDQSEQLRDLASRSSEDDLRFDRHLERTHRRVGEVVSRVERTFPHLSDRLIIVPPNGERDVVIDVDERRLMQVFHNLFSNADRFSPHGSPIVVETERADGAMVFSIADIGPGVPPQDADRVFAPFSRLGREDDGEGAGLGLYIAQQIVEAHGGRIWVEPSLAGGASFRFSVPVSAEGGGS
ncbi:MAG: ATP-binding protein [Actinomycetota bacterium]